MRITERVVLGLLGTVLLTSLILFAMDAYCAKQAAAQLDTLAKIGESAKINPTANADLYNEDVKPSIGTKERTMVSQTQEQIEQEKQMASSVATPDGQAEDSSQSAQSSKPASTANTNTFQTVTQDYFSDALFIGDSRTVGMQQSNLLPNATYYAKTGIGIGDFLSQRIVYENGTMISVEDALYKHSFGKVYIMLGINDMSRGDADWFTGEYAKILEVVRQTQPDAVIYIQGNIPMSYHTQDSNGSLNNKNLSLRNEASRTLADSENIFYLDIDEIYADANGHLASYYTADGLHVSPKHYPLWVDYLLHHAIVR